MLVTTLYDLQNPDENHTVSDLLLMMVKEIPVDQGLPTGEFVEGYIQEVLPLPGGRLVELTIEIDDDYEYLYEVEPNPVLEHLYNKHVQRREACIDEC